MYQVLIAYQILNLHLLIRINAFLPCLFGGRRRCDLRKIYGLPGIFGIFMLRNGFLTVQQFLIYDQRLSCITGTVKLKCQFYASFRLRRSEYRLRYDLVPLFIRLLFLRLLVYQYSLKRILSSRHKILILYFVDDRHFWIRP